MGKAGVAVAKLSTVPTLETLKLSGNASNPEEMHRDGSYQSRGGAINSEMELLTETDHLVTWQPVQLSTAVDNPVGFSRLDGQGRLL